MRLPPPPPQPTQQQLRVRLGAQRVGRGGAARASRQGGGVPERDGVALLDRAHHRVLRRVAAAPEARAVLAAGRRGVRCSSLCCPQIIRQYVGKID